MKENMNIHWSEYALKHTYQHANDNMKLFKKYDNEFINALCKQFCSIYSETLKQFI